MATHDPRRILDSLRDHLTPPETNVTVLLAAGTSCAVPVPVIAANLPHEDFVRWSARLPRGQPVEVFATNYDVLIETALEAEGVAAFDGFVGCNRPFFSHETRTGPENAPGPAWTRLWKIHGSITW